MLPMSDDVCYHTCLTTHAAGTASNCAVAVYPQLEQQTTQSLHGLEVGELKWGDVVAKRAEHECDHSRHIASSDPNGHDEKQTTNK